MAVRNHYLKLKKSVMPLRIFGGFFLFALKDYLSDDS